MIIQNTTGMYHSNIKIVNDVQIKHGIVFSTIECTIMKHLWDTAVTVVPHSRKETVVVRLFVSSPGWNSENVAKCVFQRPCS
jgi:hypothetical protein